MTEENDKVHKIDEISSLDDPKEIHERIEAPERIPPDRDHFDSLMSLDQQQTLAPVNTGPTDKVSLMEHVRDINKKVEAVSRSAPSQIVAQAHDVIKQIEQVKSQLATPNLELKDSVQNLLKNKLSHIDESLKIAMNRAGLEYKPQEMNEQKNFATPIEKFIGLLTHGQYQLERLSNDVTMMQKNNQQLTPTNMLALQIKVGFIQQEIELFTNMLNKMLESTKTIMNVQI